MKTERLRLLTGLLLVLAALAAYRNSLDAPFLFDDAPAIAGNPSIRHLWPLTVPLNPPADGSGVSGRPVANLSLALNYALGGFDVRGYHALNLLLHVLATLVLWGVLRRTLRWPRLAARFGADADLVAGCVALLWTVHPLLTESVDCVVQRNEILGALFTLLTLYAFIRSVEAPGWQAVAVAAGALGMASKETVAVAPLLVLLYDRTFVAGSFAAAWRRRRKFYGALAATWLLLAWLMVHTGQRAGTVGLGLGVSSWDYLLTQCRALTIYLKLAFWPHPLVLDYGWGEEHHLAAVWGRALVVVGLLLAALVALRRRPVLGFVGAVFFVVLAPSSSFVPLVTQTIAEHRMYLPLVPVIALAVVGLHRLIGRWTFAAGLAAALALGVATQRRNEEYRSDLTVWAGVLEQYPQNARAESGLGLACFNRGDYTGALRHFAASARLAPGFSHTCYNLGLTLDKLGRPAEAAEPLRAALRADPGFAPAHAELAAALLKLGRLDEAEAHVKAALADDPVLVIALAVRGELLAKQGRLPEALAAYEDVLKREPGLADVHFNEALALVASGRPAEAEAHYRTAVRLDPRHAEARLNLGILLARTGRVDEGIGQLREAVRLEPGLPEVHANLGLALAVAGRPAEAVGCYEAALRLRPGYAVARYNLGNALLGLHRRTEARAQFAEAVRLAPDFDAAREMLGRLDAAPPGP